MTGAQGPSDPTRGEAPPPVRAGPVATFTPANPAAVRAEELRALAADAFAHGQAAIARRDIPLALRELDRAARLAKDDTVIALTLAACRLETDPRAAAAGFAGVAATHDLHAAWTGLAAARLRLGDAPAAAAAMARALSGHAVRPQDAPLADAIAHAAGFPGWAGMDGRFRTVTSPGDAPVAWGRIVRTNTFRPARAVHTLTATLRGAPLLGSPIRIHRIRRTDGILREAPDGGLHGWASHPASPQTPPKLMLSDAAGNRRPLHARLPAPDDADAGPLAQPRGFACAATELVGWTPPFRVTGPDGRDLPGSPLHPGLRRPLRLVRSRPRQAATLPAITVVIPVCDGGEAVLDCLASVIAAAGPLEHLVLVDDGSRDPAIRAALSAYADTGLATLIRHERSRGFPRAANAGLAVRPPGSDAVLLNSDVLVPRHWARRLARAAHADPDCASASPLSNDATILSFPNANRPNPPPDQAATDALDLLAQQANGAGAVPIPTTVGFCMYLRDDAMRAIGRLEERVFAQGYGEENDWCARATAQGWRHLAVPGVFVSHVSGATFGAARPPLLARNMGILARLHPGYFAAVADHAAADPLAPARQRLDRARLLGAVRPAPLLIVTHDQGGGVERAVQAQRRAAEARGQDVVIIRPGMLDAAAPAGTPAVTVVSEGPAGPTPNLAFRLPSDAAALQNLLRALKPRRIALHHLVGHDPSLGPLLAALGPPLDVFVHDYAGFCAQATFTGPGLRYCGEPDAAACAPCVTARGLRITDAAPITKIRDGAAGLLRAAARVIVPSGDVAVRLRRYVPGLRPDIVPLDDVAPPAAAPARPASGFWTVAAIGAIGPEKGLDVLEALAEDARARRLPLRFVLVGYATRERQLLASGRATITGPYKDAERTALIRAQGAQVALLPSVWPETWSYTLSEAWEAGLPVLCFDIGAPADRIRAASLLSGTTNAAGAVLPLGLSTGATNDAILRHATRLCRAAGPD